jgi:hypothetical protein
MEESAPLETAMRKSSVAYRTKRKIASLKNAISVG